MGQKEKTLDNQDNEFDFIDDVNPWFFVALVYSKSNGDMLLRSLTTKANNKDEALGKAMKYFEDDARGYGLIMKAINCPDLS